jgi:glycine oxidase
VRLALDVPGDHSVDPRRMVAALAAAFARAGGTHRHARVAAVVPGGLRLADGELVRAEQVVLAPGASAARIAMPDEARVPIRPVKGQTLRLRDPRGPGLVDRTIRGIDAYLVPRADGEYVLGATMEERGHDTAPTAGGVYELLRDMSELVPGVLELEISELPAGLRPATPDNLPAIGPGAADGLLWAAGHYRNGIVLAPVTAEAIAACLTGGALPDWAAAADPRRFAGVPA